MMGPGFETDPLGLAPLASVLGVSLDAVTMVAIGLLLWSLVWKALALWHSARNHQKIWFVVMLVSHTFGLLEIAYVLWFKKNNNPDVGATAQEHVSMESSA